MMSVESIKSQRDMVIYDPSKTNIHFANEQIVGRVSGQYYKSEGCKHLVYLQATSYSLKSMTKGRKGKLSLRVHSGGDNYLTIDKQVQLEDIRVDSLSADVPTVTMVFIEQN